jgi:hypothetical protein
VRPYDDRHGCQKQQQQEDTMNVYVADTIARQHSDDLMASATAARRARRARTSGRAARSPISDESDGREASTGQTQSEPQSSRVGLQGVAAAHFVARPFTAFHSWLAAGQL